MIAAAKGARELLAAAALLGLALAAAGVVAGVGARYNARLDVTTTGEQRLAPRTVAILDRAASLGEVEIVVAVDAASLDPWSRRTVGDVLDLFGHTRRVRAGEIDVGSAAGQTEFGTLLDRLLERERPGIDRHIAAVRQAAAEAGAVADAMSRQLAPALLGLRDALTAQDPTTQAARTGVEQWATLLGVSGRQLADAGTRAVNALSEPDPVLPIPPLADHEAALEAALVQRASDLEALAAELGPVSGSGLGDASAGPAAAAIAQAARQLRDRLARQADAIARLPRLDVLRVARALGSSEVALVIGPPGTGVTGIDIGALYEPSVVATDGTRVTGDVRFQAEELLGSAVEAVMDASRPIVVFVHGGASPVLDSLSGLSGVKERLTRHGMDIAEWPASKGGEPPDLSDLDPDGVRPVVYVTLSPDSSAAARREGDVAGPEQAVALGRAIGVLLDRREAVLLSVAPSILPSYGEADPVVAPLARFGVEMRTGAPILTQVADTRSRRVLTEMVLRPDPGDHPILRATRNLRTVLNWPISAGLGMKAPETTATLLTIDDAAAWEETQWLRLWQTPPDQYDLLPDAPAFDEGIDGRGKPWRVALAISRPDQPEDSRGGRVVVVGSYSWFTDRIAFAHQSIDGRVALVAPGNAELFEAAVLWLAGEDEQIGQSAGARATALVGPLDAETLRALRWGLVAGLPVLTLMLGVVWRVARG